jgi:hypothetical protein
MATNQTPKTTAAKTEKVKRPPVKLCDRIKTQLNAAALRNKVTLDDLADLEQSIKRLAVFLGAA